MKKKEKNKLLYSFPSAAGESFSSNDWTRHLLGTKNPGIMHYKRPGTRKPKIYLEKKKVVSGRRQEPAASFKRENYTQTASE